MRFEAQPGASIAESAADAIVVFHFDGEALSESTAGIDAALAGVISSMVATGELKGGLGKVTSIHTFGKLASLRVFVAGAGKRPKADAESIRRASGAVAKRLEEAGVVSVAVELPEVEGQTAEALARAVVEGALLAAYRFDLYLSSPRPASKLERITLIGPSDIQLDGAICVGEAMAAGANFARDLVNEPPNVLNPGELTRRAQKMASDHSLSSELFDVRELEGMGMGALLAVGRGSASPPYLVALHYRGDPNNKHATFGLVGKGITFDTGGMSLKPGQDMHIMKSDMGGAAAMLGAMFTIAELKPELNVTVLVATAENMPDGDAYRNGDILRAKNGKTIEIQNTDAEGRLVLADALSYAVELGLAPIIDAATLTGACSVALGPFYSGLFSNDEATSDALLDASKIAGERLWPMPMDPDYRPLLDSSCADMRNVGGREGGAITAAMFLAEFVGDQPWVHLDIAPTAFADNATDYYAKGLGTGHPSRSLAQLALSLAAR